MQTPHARIELLRIKQEQCVSTTFKCNMDKLCCIKDEDMNELADLIFTILEIVLDFRLVLISQRK